MMAPNAVPNTISILRKENRKIQLRNAQTVSELKHTSQAMLPIKKSYPRIMNVL